MMKKVLTLTLLIIAIGTLSGMYPEAQAASYQRSSSDDTFGIGLGYLTGNTLYHISAYDATGGIESELEFPLKTLLLGLEYSYIGRNARGQDALKIGIRWSFNKVGSFNIDNGSGKLKDSDWLTDNFDIEAPPSPPNPPNSGFPHPGLDIYSESDIDLKATIIDLRASYGFWPSARISLGPLGGLLYQNFQYDASNVRQVGFGPWASGATGSFSGKVLTYEVTYIIPYLGIHSGMLVSKNFQAFLDLGYSPWASAEDRDDHILRRKTSQAKTTGYAYLVTITAQWDIKDNDFFLVRGQYLEVNTTGPQTQTFYDGSGDVITGINDKITSQQTSLSLTFSHRF